MIIDIEGTDGSGKKTQTDLLFKYLVSNGNNCLKISFPNYDSPSSAPVKMYLGGELGDGANCLNSYQASSLYAVDRLITLKKIDLSEYDYVLFDRYVPSNMIHQATLIRDNKARENFLNWVEDFEYNKLGLPRPDVVVFLDMPVEASLKLIEARKGNKNGQKKDILENKEHLLNAYASAKYVADKYKWIHIKCVDNSNKIKSVEKIHEEILTNLNLK